MFQHRHLQIGIKLNICEYFYPGRGSETKLQVDEKLSKIT